MNDQATVPETTQTDETPIPQVTSTPATVNRLLLCFRTKGWTRNQNVHEARPGIVTNAFGGASVNCNVNVFLDGGNDGAVLQDFRASPSGNTLMSVPIYDSLTREQREALAKKVSVWCEWPPMPKPSSAPTALSASLADVEARLSKTTQALIDLAALLKNAGPPTKHALSTVLTTLGINPEPTPS